MIPQVYSLISNFYEDYRFSIDFQEPTTKDDWNARAEFYIEHLSIKPGNHIAWENLGESLEHLMLPALAEKVYRVAIDIQILYVLGGKKEFIRENYRKALSYFLAARPVTKEVDEYIGFCLVKLKCWRIAASFFEGALQETPDTSLEYLAATCLTLKEEEVPFEIANAIIERESLLAFEKDII